MIIDRKNAASFCEELKLNGKQVVFTNGCFDIIHAGHVRYLTTAKISNFAAGIAVRKLGTSTVSATELISTLERSR